MQLSHTLTATSYAFDDPNLVASSGLVPTMALAEGSGLLELAEGLSVPGDKGANPGLKVASLVGGMVAGADCIDDMAMLRHGGMGRLFTKAYAPSTLGSFLRAFTFGHVRQLDSVAAGVLTGLAARTCLLRVAEPSRAAPACAATPDAAAGAGSDADAGVAGTDEAAGAGGQRGGDGLVLVDVDDTIVEVHGHAKQAAAVGYSKVRGLNALLVTASTGSSAPVIVGQRLRRGNCNSVRGAGSLITQALNQTRRVLPAAAAPGQPAGVRCLVRADSAFFARKPIGAAIAAGADVSVTVRLNPRILDAIGQIPEQAWQPVTYTNPVPDPDTGELIHRAQVAEIDFVAFTAASSKNKPRRDRHPAAEDLHGRLVVRRVPPLASIDGDQALFTTWRYHAFFTTVPATVHDTLTADQVHRGHAIVEQVIADLKDSALAHLPSASYPANAAWLTLAVLAYNLTRTAATLTDTSRLARARTATIRRTLINLPARIARSARRIRLHLPAHWPWAHAWQALFTAATT